MTNSWYGLYQNMREKIKGTDVLLTLTENREGDQIIHNPAIVIQLI